jgi:hypothetical protein
VKAGQPQRGTQPARNLGVSVAGEVNDALRSLALSQGWSKSYLVEQVLRNYLELPADYSWSDLQVIKLGLLE